MPNQTTGPANPSLTVTADPAGSAWDFASLRQRGMATLERLAGTTWTDHNAHDPGITILEQLCYVLTDLAYRANYDVRDLLAGAGPAGPLFPAAEVLTTCPVTLADLRKLALDVEGVRNVWIEPASTLEPQLGYDPAENAFALDAPPPAMPVRMRGVYRVLVAPDRGGVDPAAVAGRLHAARPLGMDFLAPEVLQEQKIAVVAEIEIDNTVPPADVLRAAYRAASGFISPRIRFYSQEEMLARGRTPDEIFDGPRLLHGFIDSDELARAERVTELHTSDLLAIFMALDGVRAVHRLGLQKDQPARSKDGFDFDQTWASTKPWVLTLEPSQTPTLDLQATVITLVRSRVQWNPPSTEIALLTADLLRADAPPILPDAAIDQPLALGTGRQMERYHSLQHHLPQVYGLGTAGLPAGAMPERRAQVRQLRAYLTMFDQVLANGFSQMAHARDLFSIGPNSAAQPSYFGQLPTDVPCLGELLTPGFDHNALQTMLELPGGDGASARQQKFLDHLMAWFAEDFGDFKLQSQALQRTPAECMEPQRAFLRDYPAVSGGLGRAFDYTRPSWGESNLDNLGGLEKRLAYKLGLARFYRRALADLPPEDEGGFHLLEHLLLRPDSSDLDAAAPLFLAQPLNNDPYSAQLSVVFPDWIIAFGAAGGDTGKSLRDSIGKMVRDETPAHLSVRLHWLTRDQMTAFEPGYRTWLASMVTSA